MVCGMFKLKKILFLLLSVNVLVAVPSTEIANVVDKELTTRQKYFVYVLATAGNIGVATGVAKQAVSCLPEKAPMVAKAGVFIPVALAFLVGGYYCFDGLETLGFYKRHKWLLLGL